MRDDKTDQRRERVLPLRPPWTLPGLAACQTTRRGGHGEPPYASLNLAHHVGEPQEQTAQNWLAVEADLGWGRGEIATVEQVHGSRIVRATTGGHRGEVRADALISLDPGVAVGVFTADCVPLLLAATDAGGRVRGVAAAHCGWRGAAAGLAAATASELAGASQTRTHDLRIWIGAAIGGASYEVGPEVAERFADIYRTRGEGDRWHLDLAEALRGELLGAGVRDEHIASCGLDTYTEPELLFSYRRAGGSTGRMLSFIGWREPGDA